MGGSREWGPRLVRALPEAPRVLHSPRSSVRPHVGPALQRVAHPPTGVAPYAMDSENPYPKSKPPLKWLKVPVSTDLHTKLRDKATELEQQDIAKEIEPWVNKFCVHINNVTQNMYDALVDICYNVGPGVLRYHFAQAILNGSGQATISNLWTQTAITTIVNGERVEEDGLKVRRKNEVELYFS